MKKLFSHAILVLTLMVVPMVLAPAFVTGCHSPTAQKKEANSLFTVGATVDAAYKSYIDLVISKQVKTNAFPAVAQKYRTFQTVFNAAVVVVVSSTNAPVPTDVQIASEELLSAIIVAKKK